MPVLREVKAKRSLVINDGKADKRPGDDGDTAENCAEEDRAGAELLADIGPHGRGIRVVVAVGLMRVVVASGFVGNDDFLGGGFLWHADAPGVSLAHCVPGQRCAHPAATLQTMNERQARKRHLVTKKITVPGNFAQGCRDFNEGRFFESHEAFEEVWQEEQGEVRDLYKGLIQIAAAFVHLSRGKFIGADRLLRSGAGYLEPFRAEGAMGFDVDTIARAAEDVQERLRAAGPDSVDTVDLSRRPRYEFDDAALAREAQKWGAWGFDADGLETVMEITVPG